MKRLNAVSKYVLFVVCVGMLAGGTQAFAHEWFEWPVGEGGNGHWYALTAIDTWPNAEAEAVGVGGHLVTINDGPEEQWLRDTFPSDENFYVGFTDQFEEGHWEWIGEVENPGEYWDGGIWQDPDNFANPIQTSYTNWRSGEPNDVHQPEGEDIAVMNYPFGASGWADLYIDQVHGRGIIEVPEPATLSFLAFGGLFATRRRR